MNFNTKLTMDEMATRCREIMDDLRSGPKPIQIGPKSPKTHSRLMETEESYTLRARLFYRHKIGFLLAGIDLLSSKDAKAIKVELGNTVRTFERHVLEYFE